MTNDRIKFRPFITEVQKRLEIVHDVKGFNSGKNKVAFEANNYPVLVVKSYDNSISRVIISCGEMFPYVINTELEAKEVYLKEKDIINAVNSLDTFFMQEAGYNNCYGVCSVYNAAKFLLLPFFIYDYRKKKDMAKTQDDILNYLMYKLTNNEANNAHGYVFIFSGQHKKSQKQDKVFLVSLHADKMYLYDFDYDGQELDIESGNNFVVLPYDKYSNTTGISIVKNKLKNYTNFKMLDADISCVVDDEVKELC